jgi:hypothetical protein
MRVRLAAGVALLGLACCLISRPPLPTAAPTQAPATLALPRLVPTSTSTPTPPSDDFPPTPIVDWSDVQPQREALLEAFAADASTFPLATRYWIEAVVRFDPLQPQALIDGRERVRFTNPLERPLDDLVLMLWPNDDQYAAEMQAGPAIIDGQIVTPEPEPQGVGLRFHLPTPLPAGETLDLTIPFSIVASGPIRPQAPKRFGIVEDILLAPTFYPLVPRLTPEGEWQALVAPPGGDTTNSDIAFYDVQLTVPEALAVAATGREVERVAGGDGTLTVRFASGPVRDFAFALGRFVSAEARAGEVVVRAWVLEAHAAAAEDTARVAAQGVKTFGQMIGAYPYDELDVVDAPGAFGGIEYPGLVFIGVVGESWADLVVVHEVAHQWFYALIGNDQLLEPWLDEAAASYAESLYYEATGDPRSATRLLDEDRVILRSMDGTDTPIGLPVSEYATENDYGVFVYLKGALFFEALRNRLGERGFGTFLQTYFENHRYGFATAASFQSTAEATCSCDLDDLFDLWVYEGGELPLP